MGGVLASGSARGLTFKETLLEIFSNAMELFAGFRAGFQTIVGPLKDILMPAWKELRSLFMEVFAAFGTGSIETGASMKDIGIIIGLFVGGPLRLVVTVLTVVIRTFVSFGRIALAFFRPFHEGFKQVAGGFLDLITGVGSFKDAVVRIFSGLEQVMTAPIRGAINAILKMMEQVIVSPALAPLFSKLGLSPETLAGDLSALSEKIATAPIFESSEATKALKRDKRQRAAATSLEIPPIELPAAEDSTICVNAELHVEGEEMAIATTRASSELAERAGASISPWQKRQILERGGIAFTAR